MLAAIYRGTIINADSQQIYRDLPILTAQPDAAGQQRLPHRLYGFADASERGSVARWRTLALAEIEAAGAAGRLPIVVGGSGLYLRALTRGLAPVPDIPAEIRAEAAALHGELGGAGFRDRLAALDPAAARRLPAGDTARLLRAWEVARATGRPLAEWQARGGNAPLTGRVATILLMPPRDSLYAACDARFAAMIAAGGLDEAAALAARRLDRDLPAMKAVGVPELLAYLAGRVSLPEAIAAAQRATRRYAKRQTTWFRHQLTPDLLWSEQYSERLAAASGSFVEGLLLTGLG